MRVNTGQMQQVAMLADIGGQASIKKLDYNERKAMQVMMNALQQHTRSASITLTDKEFTLLTDKLWSGIGTHKAGASFALVRFFKGIANIFFGRVGSKGLSDQVGAAHAMSPSEAAVKLRSMIASLVTAKELTLDYIENKLPKALNYEFLGQSRAVKDAQKQFDDKLEEQFNKILSIVDLGDVIRLGLSLFSNDTLERLWQLKENIQKMGRLFEDLQGQGRFTEERVVGPSSSMDALKDRGIAILDDCIAIVKEMYKELAPTT
jgi:hypothetical protein